jgi:hypothetical protein
VVLRTQVRPLWLDTVRRSLDEKSEDLFPQYRLQSIVRQVGALAITPLEREVVECIRAQVAFRQLSSSLVAGAMRAVAKRVGERSCEQLCSAAGGQDGVALRRILGAARPRCRTEDLIDADGSVIEKSRLLPRNINLDEPISK